MTEYLRQFRSELEFGVGAGREPAPLLRYFWIQRPIKGCVDFDEIEEGRNVYQFVNAALLQILGIDGAPPIGIREAGNAYQNLRHKLPVPYVLDSFLPIVVPFSFIPHELRELDNKPPQVKNRTLVGE